MVLGREDRPLYGRDFHQVCRVVRNTEGFGVPGQHLTACTG